MADGGGPGWVATEQGNEPARLRGAPGGIWPVVLPGYRALRQTIYRLAAEYRLPAIYQDERWDVGHRIRDVEVGPDGALWMLEDSSSGGLFRVTPK